MMARLGTATEEMIEIFLAEGPLANSLRQRTKLVTREFSSLSSAFLRRETLECGVLANSAVVSSVTHMFKSSKRCSWIQRIKPCDHCFAKCWPYVGQTLFWQCYLTNMARRANRARFNSIFAAPVESLLHAISCYL